YAEEDEEAIEFVVDFSCLDDVGTDSDRRGPLFDDDDDDDYDDDDDDDHPPHRGVMDDVMMPRTSIDGETNLQYDVMMDIEREMGLENMNGYDHNHDLAEGISCRGNSRRGREHSSHDRSDSTCGRDDEKRRDGTTTRGRTIEESSGYEPTESIACLISDLDAGIAKSILESDTDAVARRSGSDDSSSHDEGDCSGLLGALGYEFDRASTRRTSDVLREGYKQPLLMSAMLLETLPVPMPSGSSEDPRATFTRRMQKYHAASRGKGNKFSNVNVAIQVEDELLEIKLSDTIHRGYFSDGEDDDCDSDYFDPIVMEEILNVPWPFDVIDLNESFLNDEINSDSDDSVDHLNVDTYISNRLAELDLATGEIMNCMLSRVGRKGDAIHDGMKTIFAAEMDVSTAILFAKSSREFLHRAKNGYELSSARNEHKVGQHNVILGALDVLQYADSKDRLRYLLDTIDQLSSIFDQEARWWKDIDSRIIAHDKFQNLLSDTMRLKDMVRGEELLNHVACLINMKDRLNNLPDLFHKRIEDSLADLFARALRSDGINLLSFDEYLSEFESLVNAWLSSFHMKSGNDAYTQQSQLSVIEDAWSGCIIKILCFEISKAVVFSMIDPRREERTDVSIEADRGELEKIQDLVCQMKDESGLESLSHRLLKARLSGGHHNSALSSIFFDLTSRLVEIMNMYDVTLQWLKVLIDRVEHIDGATECTFVEGKLNNSAVSSMSSDERSSSTSDEESNEEVRIDQASSTPIPENLVFTSHFACSTLDQYRAIHKSVKVKHIRRRLLSKCESALIHMIELSTLHREDVGVQSGDSTDFAAENLRLTYGVLLQLESFSSYFLGDDDGDGRDQCIPLKAELTKLFQEHLRHVYIEAMKTTGTLLEHEAWQLAPLELPGRAAVVEANGDPWTIIQAVYQAVEELVLASSPAKTLSEPHIIITKRAEDRGHRYCCSFGHYLDRVAASRVPSPKKDASQRRLCRGILSEEFISAVLQFVEIKPSGVRTLSILTQSSSNGLLKWTSRLLAIGSALPLVAGDASAAVITLFDLYILTVFRFCAINKSNEDVLIGFGRGASACSASSTFHSITIEADAVAPRPREYGDFIRTQDFISCSRERLQNIVNLDKFQPSSSDMCPTSSRSKNPVANFARKLESQAAAACSCFFVAILVDVASAIYNDRQDQPSQKRPLWTDLKGIATLIEKDEDISGLLRNEGSLETYALSLVAIVPKLVTQATRYATINSISGKEHIFQIISRSRVWENHDMQEQSNSYVDDLCQRSAILWGCMSSSKRLPPSALQFTWNELVRSAFMLILEGFSKVVNCSTEGRSLMSMDLATLSHGFIPTTVQAEVEDDYPNIGPPPQACREEMMRYVDKFIKVFFYPIEDMMSWIKDNSGDYHMDHCLSLVTAKAAESKDKNFMTDGKKAVASIYENILNK
ncbi:hypothetical protein ACHAXA_004846, partial [Cyclostephanos tholiformis]